MQMMRALKGLPSNRVHFFTSLILALKRKQNNRVNTEQHWLQPEPPATPELGEHRTCLWGFQWALLLVI